MTQGAPIADVEAALLRDVLTRRHPIDIDALRDTNEALTDPLHQRIANAILTLDTNGDHIDALTVAHHLNLDPTERHRLALLLEGPLGNARAYADIIAEHNRNHRITLLLQQAAREASNGNTTTAITLAGDALTINDTTPNDTNLTWLRDALLPHLDTLEARADGTPGGIPTGFAHLDRIIGGLRGGQLIVVAGRPAMGKSVFGAHLALAAADHDTTTVIASVEMSTTEILDRLIANRGNVHATALRNGPGERDWERITTAIADLATLPIAIDDRADATLATIRADAHRTGAGLVIVDYLQLLGATTRRDSREREVADLSNGLKRLARELDAPIVALAQLNRSLELRRDKRPQLSDLRESGAIENDADVVIGLYRDDVYDPDSKDAGILEAIVLKQRAGPLGTVRLGWTPTYQTISNLEAP